MNLGNRKFAFVYTAEPLAEIPACSSCEAQRHDLHVHCHTALFPHNPLTCSLLFPYRGGMRENLADLDARERERVGATLRAVREVCGYKTGEFANELGISHGYLSNIEAGRKRLTPQLLAKAAQVLGVRPIAIVREGYFEEVA